MINMLGGNKDTVNSLKKCIGQIITDLAWSENSLVISFDNGTLTVWDNGQSCCEHRYMIIDDDLKPFIGAKFLGIEAKAGPSDDKEDGDVHEIQFLDVKTNKGVFQAATHNEHNGYYGGFSPSCLFRPWKVCETPLRNPARG